jgi:hypothetical protein
LVQDACRKIDIVPLGGSSSDHQGFARELEATVLQRPRRSELA